MKDYQDEYLRKTVQRIIDLQQDGKFVIAGYKAEFGLPTRDMLVSNSSRLTMYSSSGHDYLVGNVGFLDYDSHSGHYIFSLNQGSELPEALHNYRHLRLGEASIDQAKRVVKIIVDGETIFLRHAPVWFPPYELMSQINRELVRTETGIIIWKLIWENEDQGEHLFEAGIPRLRNGQTMVYLSGYAIDPEARILVYAGCFGYKTSIESVRVSIQNSTFLTIGFDYHSDIHLSACGKYRYLWQNLPEYSSHHACFIQHHALPKHWTPEDLYAYVLVFNDSVNPDNDLKAGLMQRLGEVLDFPVLNDWQENTWETAMEAGLIQVINTAGDCKAGIKINLKSDWQQMFETMLTERVITVS